MSEVHGVEPTSDDTQQEFGYGDGGVPWYLLLYYLGFLVFFTWYVLEYQLPQFLDEGPGQPGMQAEAPAIPE